MNWKTDSSSERNGVTESVEPLPTAQLGHDNQKRPDKRYSSE